MQRIAATVLQRLVDLCRLLQLHDLQHITQGSTDQHIERHTSHFTATIKGAEGKESTKAEIY
jgi:hypothetical protein